MITHVINNDQCIAAFTRFQLDDRSIREDRFRVLEATFAPNVDLTLVSTLTRSRLAQERALTTAK